VYGVLRNRELKEAVLLKFLCQAEPSPDRILGLGLALHGSERRSEERLQGGAIPEMLDRAVGFDDEKVVGCQRRRWRQSHRILAESQNVERVCRERTCCGSVRDRTGLSPFSPGNSASFFSTDARPGGSAAVVSAVPAVTEARTPITAKSRVALAMRGFSSEAVAWSRVIPKGLDQRRGFAGGGWYGTA
jgi:hypothetical protein